MPGFELSEEAGQCGRNWAPGSCWGHWHRPRQDRDRTATGASAPWSCWDPRGSAALPMRQTLQRLRRAVGARGALAGGRPPAAGRTVAGGVRSPPLCNCTDIRLLYLSSLGGPTFGPRVSEELAASVDSHQIDLLTVVHPGVSVERPVPVSQYQV
eukprot:gene10537-biopygen21322